MSRSRGAILLVSPQEPLHPPDGRFLDIGGGNGFVSKGLMAAGLACALPRARDLWRYGRPRSRHRPGDLCTSRARTVPARATPSAVERKISLRLLRSQATADQPPETGPERMLVHGWVELAPNAGPGRLGNSGFIRGSAGRGCRAADEARSAFCRQASYADECRYSLYAKSRIFAELRRSLGTSWRSGTLNGTCR